MSCLRTAMTYGSPPRRLAVESENAQRSRDRLTVASGVGACRRASLPVPVRRASAPHLNHAVETTGLHTGDVRRGARGADRMQSRYDNRSAYGTGQWLVQRERPYR
jgi:hypothetical protein